MSQRIIKVLNTYETNKNRTFAILEVDPLTYSQIKNKDVLYIGWRAYKYVDHINIVQCYKCWKLGQMVKNCRSEKDICPKCTGDHKSNECQSKEVICVNCKYALETLKIPNIDFHHTAFDRKCEAYKRIFGQLEKKVNYTDSNKIQK